MMWGGELVLRDGVPVGQVTSAAWGEALGATVGLAYVRDPDDEVVTPEFVRAGSYQVDVGGRIAGVSVSLRPPFDPAGERVRGGRAG
jgi:glycine cleavage system aminomethyltransferase T